ncbi:hypothetical protein ACO1O0_003103 [Amphichorda felina]
MPTTATHQPHVRLLAESHRAGSPIANDDLQRRPGGSPSFFTSAQWTADGTSVVVGSSDKTVHAFVLPDDLLDDGPADTRQLSPQGTVRLPEPTQTITPAPYFSLGDASTQTFLAGCRDHPIHLYHAFPDEGRSAPLYTYKLIRAETEAYITPSSLIWQYPGTHFLCGSTNRLDLFDVSGHASDGPITTIPTIPSRRYIAKGGGVGMKGTVSALAASGPDGDTTPLIAVGTWTRWVGLYDLYRTDKAVANWSIAQAVAEAPGKELGGQGIAQTAWSPDGRYLLINERHSSGLLVYDVRVTGQLLSILRGRKADTQQKLLCDVYQGGGGGFEVWAGSQDGTVHVWEGVGLHGDFETQPGWDWKAHESPVGSTGLHPSGSVAATCSGGWEHSRSHESEDDEAPTGRGDSSSTTVLDETSLKFWCIEGPQEDP